MHTRTQVKDKDGKVTGVRACCPYCMSNKHVRVLRRGLNIKPGTAKVEDAGVRFVRGQGSVYVPIALTPECYNPLCPENVKKLARAGIVWPEPNRSLPYPKKGQRTVCTQFKTSEQLYLRNSLPESVRRAYLRFTLFEPQGGCDAELAALCLNTEMTTPALRSTVDTSRQVREREALMQYAEFTKDPQAALGSAIAAGARIFPALALHACMPLPCSHFPLICFGAPRGRCKCFNRWSDYKTISGGHGQRFSSQFHPHRQRCWCNNCFGRCPR